MLRTTDKILFIREHLRRRHLAPGRRSGKAREADRDAGIAAAARRRSTRLGRARLGGAPQKRPAARSMSAPPGASALAASRSSLPSPPSRFRRTRSAPAPRSGRSTRPARRGRGAGRRSRRSSEVSQVAMRGIQMEVRAQRALYRPSRRTQAALRVDPRSADGPRHLGGRGRACVRGAPHGRASAPTTRPPAGRARDREHELGQ